MSSTAIRWASTGDGGKIHKTAAAEIMYGTGSKQHLEAMKRFGVPPREASAVAQRQLSDHARLLNPAVKKESFGDGRVKVTQGQTGHYYARQDAGWQRVAKSNMGLVDETRGSRSTVTHPELVTSLERVASHPAGTVVDGTGKPSASSEWGSWNNTARSS